MFVSLQDVVKLDATTPLYEEVLAVAAGRRTKSEEFGFGDEEFVPGQLGAVL